MAPSAVMTEHIGRYIIRERLGGGGMGDVYRAEDPHLRREVAIKVIRSDPAELDELKERFIGEARALDRLGSSQCGSGVRLHL